MRIHPLFKQFGSSWSATRAGLYPEPEYNTIVEHYAGSAGYSLNFCEKNVYLYDTDQHITALWSWLIHWAKPQDILDIPIGLPEGTNILSLNLMHGQALLLKHWQRTNNVGDCWTISSWGNKPGQWTANTRARVAEEVQAIKHWAILPAKPYLCAEMTHFVDPPYAGNYAYKQPPIDHAELGRRCLAGRGQIIVCEGLAKDGTPPTWLPFRPAGKRVTSRRKANQSHHRMEYIWTNEVT